MVQIWQVLLTFTMVISARQWNKALNVQKRLASA